MENRNKPLMTLKARMRLTVIILIGVDSSALIREISG